MCSVSSFKVALTRFIKKQLHAKVCQSKVFASDTYGFYLYFTSSSSVKAESRQGHQPNHSPQSALSVPRNEDLVLPDHRTKPNTYPSHTTLSSGSLSLSPNPASQHPAQPSQTTGLLPPPRPHLGPQTTTSSQEFLAGSQADTALLQPVSSSSSDTQHHATAPGSSPGPTPASSPHLCGTSGPETSKGGEETEQEKPAPFFPSDRTRSPSPLFSPLRLTDKPPAVSVQDDSTLR